MFVRAFQILKGVMVCDFKLYIYVTIVAPCDVHCNFYIQHANIMRLLQIRNTWSYFNIWLFSQNTLWQYLKNICGELRVHAKQTKPKLIIMSTSNILFKFATARQQFTNNSICMLNLVEKQLSNTHMARHLKCKSNGKDQALSQTSIDANTWVTYKLLQTKVQLKFLSHQMRHCPTN